MILGAGILLFRTIRLLSVEKGWTMLAEWVIGLTFVEMAIDLLCIFFSIQWLLSKEGNNKKFALQLGAAAALFHAFRVLIYVLGRTGPWINFDLKPEYQADHEGNMFWVYFAAILSLVGIVGVIVIWRLIQKARREKINRSAHKNN